MTKLDMLDLEVKALRSDAVYNILKRLVGNRDFQNALSFTVGCLMYCKDYDRGTLEKIKELLI